MKVESALSLASQGLRVFPLSPNSKIPPKGLKWKEAATSDSGQIMEWWLDNPDYNIGVATGNGLLVVDADVKDGKPGLDSLQRFREVMGYAPFAQTATPSGGSHDFVIVDKKHRNRAGSLPGFPGLDVRCEDGYVVGPGSVLENGRYAGAVVNHADNSRSWLALRSRMLEDFLLNSTPEHKSTESSIPVSDLDQPQNIDRAKVWLQNTAPNAIEGAGGNNATYQVAARMRDFALSERTALELLAEHWNEAKASPPWPIDELAALTHNAFSYASGTWGALTPQADFDSLDIDVGPSPDIQSSKFKTDFLEPSKKPENSVFHLLTYEEMSNLPEPEWLVEGVIQKRSAALLFGKSNAFKSFLAIDIACSIATNTPWHGKPTGHGNVLYVATEGANGVGRLRIPGWLDHHKVAPIMRSGIFLFPKEIKLDTTEDVKNLVHAIQQTNTHFELIVFDIFGGTMAGSEIEDTTARQWVHNIQLIMRTLNCATLTVAHTGWQDETRARMHTHFWGSFDSRMKADGDKDALETMLTIERHKDADSGGQWGFKMSHAGATLVPEMDDDVRAARAKTGKTAEKFRPMLASLEGAIEKEGVLRLGEEWPKCKVVARDAWRDLHLADTTGEGADATSGEREKRRWRFNKALREMQLQGVVCENDGYFWAKFDE